MHPSVNRLTKQSINDAFDMSRFADYVSTRTDFVVLDHHSCQSYMVAQLMSPDFVFGDAASQDLPANQLTSTLQPGQGSLSDQMLSASSEERRNLVVDEFSCALSNDALVNSSDPIGDRRRFCTGQMESYTNATAGYSFWSESILAVEEASLTVIGYKTEQCSTDVNWCFAQAVGTSLPSTFHSYPNGTIQALASTMPSTGSNIPPNSTFLSFGTSSPSDADYSPPTTDDWLAAMGDSDPEFDEMTEALATTEYDSVSGSMPDIDTASDAASTETAAISQVSTISATALPALGSAAQAAYAVDSLVGTATIPSSRIKLHGGRRSLGVSHLPQRALLWSSSLSKHRFVTRHRRAASRRSTASKHIRRDDQSAAVGYTPEESAIAKGYADGWKAAKTFAQCNGSRLGAYRDLPDTACIECSLGFTGQFVADALAAMGSSIVSGDQQFYTTWFCE